MNYPDQWTQAQVDRFYRWVSRQPAFREHVSREFPNLERTITARHSLKKAAAKELVQYVRWLRVLPNTDFRMGRRLLLFYYIEFQKIQDSLEHRLESKRLCSLFRILIQMMLQGTSVFPPCAARLATELMNCLREYPKGAARFDILAALITDGEGRFLRGCNAGELSREQLDLLIESEHRRRAGSFEDLYKEKYHTKEKYDGYKIRVREDRGFQQDLHILKRTYPRAFTPGKKELRSDRRQNSSPNRLRHGPVFQEAFDFFCWKWFLDGMDGDEPIVTNLSFDVTPFGTTIFIPGYWSFDPKRDIKWKELMKFHQSRGVVKRQGKVFEPKRRQREEKERNALDAEEVSWALRERGTPRVERIIRLAKLRVDSDPGYVNRLAREAKKKQGRRRRVRP